MQFQPEQKKDHGVGPLAMTAGKDGKFKIWILGEDRVIKGNEDDIVEVVIFLCCKIFQE